MERDPSPDPAVVLSSFLFVVLVTQDRMAGVGKLDANLIAFAGLQFGFDNRRVFHPLQNAVVRDDFLGILGRLGDVPIEVLAGRQVRAKGAFVVGHPSGNDRGVDSLGLLLFELFDQ